DDDGVDLGAGRGLAGSGLAVGGLGAAAAGGQGEGGGDGGRQEGGELAHGRVPSLVANNKLAGVLCGQSRSRTSRDDVGQRWSTYRLSRSPPHWMSWTMT